MRESLGGSMLLNLVVIFSGLVIVFFIGILSYSKAYRVKNRIVELIEKYGVYEVVPGDMNDVIDEVNPDLSAAGYNTSNPTRCDSIRTKLVSEKYGESLSENLNKNYGYNYCVFQINNSLNGKHYVVVTFIHFQIPVIGDVLTFPVYGETKLLGKTYDY